MLDPGKNSPRFEGGHKKKSSILFLALLAILLVVATAVVAIVQSQKNAGKSIHSDVHPIVKATCAATLYPDLCVSAIATAPEASNRLIKSPRDVIIASLNSTIRDGQQNHDKIKRLTFLRIALTQREKFALQDCLEVINDGLEELHKIFTQVKDYNFSSYERTEYLRTLLSAAMTNLETCLDGFSHSAVDKEFRRKALGGGLIHVFRLCSNVLAMVKNLTDTNMVNKNHADGERRLVETSSNGEQEWPEWLSAGDRKLLQASSVTPNVIVAADGSGNYRTVQEAVAAAPDRSSSRYIIKINAGVYRENVELTSRKTNLMFIGDGERRTIITADRSVGLSNFTTFNSATVAIAGEGFLARDITFQNTAGPAGEQAVALRVNADLTAFYRCNMNAFQDTLYVHSFRQFYRRCIISGTVDFIFGNAAAVFQDCDIRPRRPGPRQRNMVTAQGRSDPNENTGIVIQNCRIGATADLQAVLGTVQTFLGRPWRMYSRTVVMFTEISEVIDPRGWFEWSGDFALDTLFYAEYRNTGPGAGTDNRVNWMGFRVLTSDAEAQVFTADRFISAANWLPATGFPFTLGL